MSIKANEPSIRAALRKLPAVSVVVGDPVRILGVGVRNSPRAAAKGIRRLAAKLATLPLSAYARLEHPPGCYCAALGGPVRLVTYYDVQYDRYFHRLDVGVVL